LFGWPIGGFMNAGLQRPGTTAAGQTALAILDGTAVDAWSAAAEERLTPDKCSYFLGVWDGRSGAPRQETPSAVLHPVSMDTFAARWAVDAMRTEIQQVRTELWDAQHRGPVRVELTALAEAADAILNRAGLAGQAPRWPTDRETSDQEMFAFLRARLQLLRDAQLGNEQLKLELRNADLHRQAVEIENKVLRERLQQAAFVGAIQVAGPVTLPQRSLAFARRQVARARNVAGAVLRRVRGR
jgi:hypothetical protein